MLKIVTFADDAHLFCSDNDVNIIKNSRKGIGNDKKRFDIDKLSLNENKTKFMVFGGGRINCEIKLNLDGIENESL